MDAFMIRPWVTAPRKSDRRQKQSFDLNWGKKIGCEIFFRDSPQFLWTFESSSYVLVLPQLVIFHFTSSWTRSSYFPMDPINTYLADKSYIDG